MNLLLPLQRQDNLIPGIQPKHRSRPSLGRKLRSRLLDDRRSLDRHKERNHPTSELRIEPEYIHYFFQSSEVGSGGGGGGGGG